MGMTMVQKILAQKTGASYVKVGDVVEPKVDLAMSHENGALVINQFLEIYDGTPLTPKVWDPTKITFVLDHRVPAESAKTATNQKKIREFAQQHGIKKFHDIRGDSGGICHQILPENGYVLPGTIVVGTDSHTTTHGALGTFAFGIGATEMASVWALGTIMNIEVPPTIKVILKGTLPKNVYSKDIILYLIGKISSKGANYKVLEFHGETLKHLSMSSRLVLSNMAVEAGATAGIIPPDAETVRYLKEEAGVTQPIDMLQPDADAEYESVVEVDVSKLTSQVACPHYVDNVKSIEEIKGIAINQIVIGSCTNGRLDDMEIAASILRGKKVAESVRLIVFPASGRIYQQALAAGYLADMMKAGAVICNPGCGPCLGVHQGALADGDVALTTTNRNFKGRMGNKNSEVYLSSTAVAAASAITGKITDPKDIEA